jgi:hypothetical protein
MNLFLNEFDFLTYVKYLRDFSNGTLLEKEHSGEQYYPWKIIRYVHRFGLKRYIDEFNYMKFFNEEKKAHNSRQLFDFHKNKDINL